jgi:hypothetical protein
LVRLQTRAAGVETGRGLDLRRIRRQFRWLPRRSGGRNDIMGGVERLHACRFLAAWEGTLVRGWNASSVLHRGFKQLVLAELAGLEA